MELEVAIKKYLKQRNAKLLSLEKLGSGLVADGYKLEYEYAGQIKKTVCRRLHGIGMSRDYLPDNVGYLLLQHEITKTHPLHIPSNDVVCFGDKIQVVSLDGIEDVFQIVEFAEGDSYVKWILDIQNGFTSDHEKVVKNITDYMLKTHKIKPKVDPEKIKHYYWRHSQDFIGSEVLMDILDVWPQDKLLSLKDRAFFVEQLYILREQTRDLYKRCVMIHSDLHPDNIRVHADLSISILDSARTIWGEPADDLTCMLANFLFFGMKFPKSRAEYQKAYDFMLQRYLAKNGSSELEQAARIYMPIRLLILAHPLFFSDDSPKLKKQVIKLAKEIISNRKFTLTNTWKFAKD